MLPEARSSSPASQSQRAPWLLPTKSSAPYPGALLDGAQRAALDSNSQASMHSRASEALRSERMVSNAAECSGSALWGSQSPSLPTETWRNGHAAGLKQGPPGASIRRATDLRSSLDELLKAVYPCGSERVAVEALVRRLREVHNARVWDLPTSAALRSCRHGDWRCERRYGVCIPVPE